MILKNGPSKTGQKLTKNIKLKMLMTSFGAFSYYGSLN